MPKPLDKRERNREYDSRRRAEKPWREVPMITDAVIAKVFSRTVPEPNSGCLLWTGAVTKNGYGVIGVGGRSGKSVYTHRIAFEATHGCCAGAHVLHRCDTPSCCNPGHLFAGTPKVNSDDKVSKDRHARGVRVFGAKLTDEAVLMIRKDSRSLSRIAADYGVDLKQIHRIKRGEAWKHVA